MTNETEIENETSEAVPEIEIEEDPIIVGAELALPKSIRERRLEALHAEIAAKIAAAPTE